MTTDDPFAPTNARDRAPFDPENLVKTVIAVPLLRAMEDPAKQHKLLSVIIDINIQYAQGREAAKRHIAQLIEQSIGETEGQIDGEGVRRYKSDASPQYVYARLRGQVIRQIVERDQAGSSRAIYHVWPDFPVHSLIWNSVATVKADACRRAFATTGKGILWAVLDSGVNADHPHFSKHGNLKDLPAPVKHVDFTTDPPMLLEQPSDAFGHGTHVAGIIAGEAEGTLPPVAIVRERDSKDNITYKKDDKRGAVFGVASQCKLVSFRVLDSSGDGEVSNVIAAIEAIQEINGFGRHIIIHGANLSLGYDFDPEWFACGQSPVCVEVDRLVRSGVAVVIAAGNTGKGFALTINDPGNAELAITVGATHRDMPHTYGVSYFSSKGPTGDGRAKPDLVAPGERIVSCGAGPDLDTYKAKAGVDGAQAAYYIERSGTSMAAPHVSGIIAGLLSVRGEFIGKPEAIKRLLIENATDLGRQPSFQGSGLVDMMRAIQAI